MRQPVDVSVLWASLAVALVAAPLAAEDKVVFNRDIRPILSDYCFLCHGPDKNHRQAGLRLDDRDLAVKRKALTPGRPDQSELVARIESADPDAVMPPADSHKK